jgi:dolichol kinase
MDIINNIDFSITHCDISEIMSEANRFLFHIMLVHIIAHIIDGKDVLFGEQIFKTLLITVIAILTYHILFKKLVEPKLKKIHNVCNLTRK